jgi:hypothetical protein
MKKIDILALLDVTATVALPQVSKKWSIEVRYEWLYGGQLLAGGVEHTMKSKLHARYLPVYIADLLADVAGMGDFTKIEVVLKGVK